MLDQGQAFQHSREGLVSLLSLKYEDAFFSTIENPGMSPYPNITPVSPSFARIPWKFFLLDFKSSAFPPKEQEFNTLGKGWPVCYPREMKKPLPSHRRTIWRSRNAADQFLSRSKYHDPLGVFHRLRNS